MGYQACLRAALMRCSRLTIRVDHTHRGSCRHRLEYVELPLHSLYVTELSSYVWLESATGPVSMTAAMQGCHMLASLEWQHCVLCFLVQLSDTFRFVLSALEYFIVTTCAVCD